MSMGPLLLSPWREVLGIGLMLVRSSEDGWYVTSPMSGARELDGPGSGLDGGSGDCGKVTVGSPEPGSMKMVTGLELAARWKW